MPIRDRDIPVALTAQDLRSGRVVYWQGEGWSDRLADARSARGAAATQALEALAVEANAGNEVVEAFVFAVTDADGTRRPAHLRESRRAAGPSIDVETR